MDKTDPVTAAIVVHDIIASCKAVVSRLRILGGDDKESLAQETETFAAALATRDYVKKGRAYLKGVAAALGIGAGTVLGFVIDAVLTLASAGALVTNAILQGLVPSVVLVVALRAAPQAWASLQQAFAGESQPDLYSRVVEPAEAQFFAQVGGGKPLFRTAQVLEMGSALALGGVLGAIALGVVIALSA
ncbi:MAG TPA: hypothetical protein VGR26_10695 [Acidimicrobiales bacterium]|nr:hypothetical protein [Acidimicrobiales bacterium]